MRAGVAQSVEQLIRNEKVEGSIPFSGTNRINDLANLARVGFFVSGAHAGNLQPSQPDHSLAANQPAACQHCDWTGGWISGNSAVEAEPQPHGRITVMLLTAFLLAS